MNFLPKGLAVYIDDKFIIFPICFSQTGIPVAGNILHNGSSEHDELGHKILQAIHESGSYVVEIPDRNKLNRFFLDKIVIKSSRKYNENSLQVEFAPCQLGVEFRPLVRSKLGGNIGKNELNFQVSKDNLCCLTDQLKKAFNLSNSIDNIVKGEIT